MFDLISAKLTGIPDPSGWSQVHEFKPDDPEKFAARGSLFAVVATKRLENGGVDSIVAGRELVSRLHEEYFGDITQKPFNAIKIAVAKVISEFKESWGDVEIAACAVVGDVVYSAAGGGGEVTVSRNGALGTILKSGEEVVAASGYPQDKDVILLGTRAFYEKMPQGIIKAALGSGSPEAAIETFGPGVHEGVNIGSLAAVVIQFTKSSVFATSQTEVVATEVIGKIPMDFNKLRTTVAANFSNILNNILKKIPQRQIYVGSPSDEESNSQNKKLTFSVALILIFVLAVSIAFGVRQKKINDLKSKYESILVIAEKNVDDAIGLASVSPEKSRELFIDSEEKLSQIEALKVKDSKVDDLRKKINESRGAILGEYDGSTELFLDLSLLSSGFKGDAISTSGGNIFILDKSGKRIISITISSKKSKVVAGPTVIDEALDLASYENRAFILASDGIYEIGNGKTKIIDKTWDGDALIKAFAGNIYVLDKALNAIYRYAGQGSTFGDRQSWLAGGTKVDFSDVRQWVIDGSVYALYPNSKISKFSLGSPQSFKVSGVVPEIGNIDAIFAGDETQYVYLLDRAGKRVVVTDKKGNYKAQYIGEDIGNASNLTVSEADKKIILLVGEKLESIEIKHLQ